MLAAWLEVPGLPETLDWFSAVAGVDLRAHGTTSDADTIRDTAVAQPLIVATSLLTLHHLSREAGLAEQTGLTAGHSVGEFAAAVAAGVLSPEQALVLVRERGAAMAQAAASTPTGMSAVLGGTPEAVTARLEELGLTPANVNGGGQVVAAGALDALASLSEEPPARAKVIPLQVAGAFHTDYMGSAVARLDALSQGLRPADPLVELLSNSDGAAVADGPDAVRRLVAQISRPVRWDLCQETMLAKGVTALIELAPGGVLSGLAKRTLRGVETVALKTPDDLDAAIDLISRHGSRGASA